MIEGDDEVELCEPRNPFQQTIRRLAEEAMTVTHHDAAESEPGYMREVQQMERRFARILKGKLKPMRPKKESARP